MIKIVFFGTPDFVLPIINTLNKNFKGVTEPAIIAVVTQKPMPKGRKRKLTHTPVDEWAFKRNENKKANIIEIFHSGEELLESSVKADIGILAAYGEILSKEVIDYFPHGILNIHPSLLPQFRGASPVPATIVTNSTAGATIMKVDEGIDHGEIINSLTEDVSPTDTTGSLLTRLFEKSTQLLVELLPPYTQGRVKPSAQDHAKASHTTQIAKNDGYIPFEFLKKALEGKSHEDVWEIKFIKDYKQKPTPKNIERFIRAMDPWPIAWTRVKTGKKEKRLKILKANLKGEKLVIDTVQLEGKNPVSWEQFSNAYQLSLGL